MHKIKSGIAIFAVILGISSAFAFKANEPKHNPLNQTLYAISTDGVNFSWVSSPPANYSCQQATGTCEISTPVTGTPAPDTYPSSYTVLQGTDKHSAYMPN
ncbi:MAG: hypothetical protein NVSMB24_27420 [Mucilaginibacter sp.]